MRTPLLLTVLWGGIAAGPGGAFAQSPPDQTDAGALNALPRAEAQPETLQVQPRWLGLRDPVVTLRLGDQAWTEERPPDRWSLRAREAFWTGFAAMLASLVTDARGAVYARTFAHSIWGLSWTAWLGYAGLAMDDSQVDRSLEGATERPRSSFAKASLQGAPGEASNMFLAREGFYFHPAHNDLAGATDKLLTGSMKIGILRTWDRFSLESTAFWRLLTPAFAPKFNAPPLPRPVGRFLGRDCGEACDNFDSRVLSTRMAHSDPTPVVAGSQE